MPERDTQRMDHMSNQTSDDLQDRIAVARRIGHEHGQRDGRYDVETYQGESRLLEITVVAVNRRLDILDAELRKRDISKERWEYLHVNEVRERAYLTAYIRAWGDTKNEDRHGVRDYDNVKRFEH